MNTFYYFEGEIYATREDAERHQASFNVKSRIDEIETEKTFNEFVDAFEELKEQGNSDLDAIEWAK